jgi:hypothetical protein
MLSEENKMNFISEVVVNFLKYFLKSMFELSILAISVVGLPLYSYYTIFNNSNQMQICIAHLINLAFSYIIILANFSTSILLTYRFYNMKVF